MVKHCLTSCFYRQSTEKPTYCMHCFQRRDPYRDLDISVRLVADELLGPLLDDLRFGEWSQGCHGD